MFAATRSRALVTYNRTDFEALATQYFVQGTPHAGIFIAVRRPVHELSRRLLSLLDAITADEASNHVLYL